MAYSKARHIEAAQKYLHQGKIAQAIGEYQQMLKQEPKDQVTLMTVGDLFVRQGETFQALEYFERLAQIFLAEGFVSKAIAVYKKIAKLAPEETRPVERLAELYVQQGVLSEARPIYLQLAELHLRAGRQQQAVGLLRKLLEAEPDNLRVRVRLAELSLTTGETAEAVASFRAAAELLQRRGDHAEAIKHADRALKADPDDVPTLALKARILAAGSQRSDAIALLQSLPGLDEGGETADLLIDLYLEAEQSDAAAELASRIFKRNPSLLAPTHHVAEALLEGAQPEQALALLDMIREATTDAGNHEQLSEILTRASEKMPERTEPREWLVEHYGRISDSFRLSDAQISLAGTYEAGGDPDRAKQIYKQILDRNPENEQVRRKLARLEHPTGRGIEIPEDADESAETQAQEGGLVEPELDEETQRYVTQVLTDVDLFSSYGLTQKAMELLEGLLVRAPMHVTAMERLLDLNLGAGNERRTAELAAQLHQLYAGRGDTAAADRYADLKRRYGRAADLSADQLIPAAPEASAPQAEFLASIVETEPEALPEIAPELSEATDEELRELEVLQVAFDSSELDELQVPSGPVLSELQSQPAAGSEDMIEMAEDGIVEDEILGEPATQEATQEVDLSDELEALARQFEERNAALAAAPAPVPEFPMAMPEFPVALQETAHEVADEAADEALLDGDLADVEPALPVAAPEFLMDSPVMDSPAAEPVQAAAPVPELPLEDFSAEPPPEYELELESLANVLDSDADSLSAEDFLRTLSDDFANVLPQILPVQADAAPWEPAEAAESNSQQHVLALREESVPEPAELPGPLTEIFEEFRAGLDDAGGGGVDLETHYNLGVAYREMGLLDEAISEFQKVAKANKKGEPFRYAMQCCTLLGLAFMDKGQPSIAAMWYQRALEIPGLDQESILALRYDLGVAQELAGETSAARQSFSQVYGMNIDYRDVAERLAALGKGR